MSKLIYGILILAISYCSNTMTMKFSSNSDEALNLFQATSSSLNRAAFVKSSFPFPSLEKRNAYVTLIQNALVSTNMGTLNLEGAKRDDLAIMPDGYVQAITSDDGQTAYGEASNFLNPTVDNIERFQKNWTGSPLTPCLKSVNYIGQSHDLSSLEKVIGGKALAQQSIFNRHGKLFTAGLFSLCVYQYAGFPGFSMISEKIAQLWRK